MGVASSNSTLPGRDHFDLIEKLTDPSYSLTQTSLLQYDPAGHVNKLLVNFFFKNPQYLYDNNIMCQV